MLSFQHLTYQIADKILVHDVSGKIYPHDFILIIGQSGSGKSLLLKLLASLLPLSNGEITFNGKTLSELTPPVWRSQIAYIAQMGELIEGTVLDNLKLPFTFNFYKEQKFDPTWHEQHLLNLGRTSQFLNQDSRVLSGGEKQLVNLLRTLQVNPSILLLDEPTASLDNETTYQVETLIKTWYQSNSDTTVVWISHEPNQIERLLDFGVSHWQMAHGGLQC